MPSCKPQQLRRGRPKASISAAARSRWPPLQYYFGRFGDIYRVSAPSRGVFNYVINHPDDVKRVLLTNHRNYTKGEGIVRVKHMLGNGIMTSEGAFWRRH